MIQFKDAFFRSIRLVPIWGMLAVVSSSAEFKSLSTLTFASERSAESVVSVGTGSGREPFGTSMSAAKNGVGSTRFYQNGKAEAESEFSSGGDERLDRSAGFIQSLKHVFGFEWTTNRGRNEDRSGWVPDWSDLLRQNGGGAMSWGVILDGPAPYSENELNPLKPASVTKLFTTFVSLKVLGDEFQYQTSIQFRWLDQSKGLAVDVTVVGSGDPTWGMEEFGETYLTKAEQIAELLKQQGVVKIIGDVNVQSNDSRFDAIHYPEGWMDGDRVAYVGGLPQSFNLQINATEWVIDSITKGHFIEKEVPTEMSLDLKYGSETDLNFTAINTDNVDSYGFSVSGTVKKSDLPIRQIYLPMNRVKDWFTALLRSKMSEMGMFEIDADTATYAQGILAQWALEGHRPDQVMTALLSPKLKDILVPFLKSSINSVGESLHRTAGLTYFSEDKESSLLNLGANVDQAILAEHGVEATLFDGSGVSHSNRVTAAEVHDLLNLLHESSYFHHYLTAMPIAGVDGTLKNRMKGTSAQGFVHAKTGTLTGAYNLAGFVEKQGADGIEYVPFVTLSNSDTQMGTVAKPAIDRVVSRLAFEVRK